MDERQEVVQENNISLPPTIKREIQVLKPEVANLIAAGEVVERPASVVKELLENSIDAGATTITIEIRKGGIDYLRITDNGCGIPKDQLPTAFLRHATSKLKSAENLSKITTLGFRGEALAAIAAVSKIKVTTAVLGETFGHTMKLEGGVVIDVEETGCPLGTTILVEDIFFNTPARKKFMKTERGEAAAISTLVQVVALSHPEIAVKFIRDGKQELSTSGDGVLQTAIFHVLGKDIALGLRPVKFKHFDIELQGFVSLPSCCRGSRTFQHFFVNGRYIKSTHLCRALEAAYSNQKMVGKFPAAVLHLSLDYREVDVNVHPAKTEVKFADADKIFRIFHRGVLNSLASNKDIQKVILSNDNTNRISSPPVVEIKKSDETMTKREKQRNSETFLAGFQKSTPNKATVEVVEEDEESDSIFDQELKGLLDGLTFGLDGNQDKNQDKNIVSHGKEEREDSPDSLEIEDIAEEDDILDVETEDLSPVCKNPSLRALYPPLRVKPEDIEKVNREESISETDSQEVETPQPRRINFNTISNKSLINQNTHRQRIDNKNDVKKQLTVPEMLKEQESVLEHMTFDSSLPVPWKVVGEFLRTYVMVELEDEMFFIDKHAAHERLNFNRLKKEGYRPMEQRLLSPVKVNLSPEELACVLNHQEIWREFAFEVGVESADKVVLSGVPHDMSLADLESEFLAIVQDLISYSVVDPDGMRDHLLHSISCKAAIKAGYVTSAEELDAIARLVMEDHVRHCPHGRPIVSTLTKKELEKKFGRIQ